MQAIQLLGVSTSSVDQQAFRSPIMPRLSLESWLYSPADVTQLSVNPS